MLFNSLEFAIFLPIVFILYWFVFNKAVKVQNLFLIVVGYIFYGWWDWRFLILLLFSSLTDYFVGLGLGSTENQKYRKILITTSICVQLLLLGFFKYFNFFVDSFADLLSMFGLQPNVPTLRIILPVGISFYTFQTLSYTIDVYRKKCEPTKNLINFLAFVSFFPQLVAGPIERATHMLTQFNAKRVFDFDKAKDGLRQILWGLFKKIVIADNCAKMVNEIFGNYNDFHGPVLFLGAFYFAFQIYCDFSGYSDIAIGTARLFGFNLMRNFAFPYFSRDIAEFWRRWHISLSTWFRDYLYIPLGGSRVNKKLQIRNTMVVFVVSGFWHGANWTFLIWGALNALYFLPLLLSNKNRNYLNTPAEGRFFPSLRESLNIFLTFSLTCFAWIFFRSYTLGDALHYIQNMFTFSNISFSLEYLQYIPMTVLFVFIEWIQRDKQHALEIYTQPVYFRWASYFLVIAFIYFFAVNTSNSFIYFQF